MNRRLKCWMAIATMLASPVAFAAVPAGAQVADAAEFCGPLAAILANAELTPLNQADYEAQVSEGAQLDAELRPVATDQLNELLDELAGFADESAEEVAAAGGIDGLSNDQLIDLRERSQVVLNPIREFSSRECPTPQPATTVTLNLACDFGPIRTPRTLTINNPSDAAREVVAGDLSFTIPAFGIDSRVVPPSVDAGDVTLDGQPEPSVVRACGPNPVEDGFDFASVVNLTLDPGCASGEPARPATLTGSAPDTDPQGPGTVNPDLRFSIDFALDDQLVTFEFPDGGSQQILGSIAPGDVTFDGMPFDVTVEASSCADAPPVEAAPSGAGKPAAPLAPKFTG